MKVKLSNLIALASLILMLTHQLAFCQIIVNGNITNIDDGIPLIGVNILVQGTSEGTVTDLDGNYSVNIPDESSILEFSNEGFETTQLTVGNQINIDLKMGAFSTALDEVMVVEYTIRKRGELTGSVNTVSAEDIERTSNKDLVKSLSAKVTGLIVSDRGGASGSTDDVNLLIRGKSTLGNNAPLILIDGLQSGSFAHLSPEDIASISVLKDGSAAIYGARVANGIIVITTIRGKYMPIPLSDIEKSPSLL